jgi:hypothetical protein
VLSRGEAGVPENREEILSQWEQYVKAEFITCVRARRQGAMKEENHE